jgi:hypothetical protein
MAHTAGSRHDRSVSGSQLACTLSLDLDDAWTYLRAAGRSGWETTATVVPLVCERLRAVLRRYRVSLTLFVITRDLEDDRKVEAIRTLVADGHEIGCHSHWHEPAFASLDREALRREILGAADLIERRLGVRPTGFRAPGFAQNPGTPEVLREGGFRYDGSFLPTFLGPLARLYYFFHAGISRAEKRRRSAMFGRFGDAFGPLRARLHDAVPEVLNLPVTTIPLLRAPFHGSYVLWLGGKSRWLARRWLDLGLGLCRLRRVPPSYLLHSLDFVGRGEHRDLDFFPGMDVAWERKQALLEHLFTRLTSRFAVQPMGPFAERELHRLAAAR